MQLEETRTNFISVITGLFYTGCPKKFNVVFFIFYGKIEKVRLQEKLRTIKVHTW